MGIILKKGDVKTKDRPPKEGQTSKRGTDLQKEGQTSKKRDRPPKRGTDLQKEGQTSLFYGN